MSVMNYTDAVLEDLLDDLESDLAERKESWSGDAPDKGRQAVCAFANDLPDHRKPGVLFVGAKDNGTPSSLDITDNLLKTLADVKTDGNISPPPTLVVQKRRLKGVDMAVVIVQPVDAPPVRYKGRLWIRIGPRRGLATAQDERILTEKRKYNDTPFDIQPIPTSTLSHCRLTT
ncbi:MAG: ATP-binding protein [Desulfobulbaceae bacterium]|nr:ATP-binding protein [Desulfobulbaceae bacterium]